ncbi:MAG: type I DNA topoisomerase, partial [Firmicutes bacterium]|nr:type I DNA topoisomerase [Bacillota bacterium]
MATAKTTNKEKTAKASKKTLVIVESPSKAKTIGKYLGSSYKVVASVGHVRDLPKSKLGIDIENDFEPQYIAIRGKGDMIKELKKEAKAAGKIYLATDPDREGEAISWHLAHLLGIDASAPCRIVFNEITKDAIKAAVKNPRAIDLKLVDAQQARRVLDRLVGYQISPLLWRKIRRGLSAGRVQSAALKIICDREKLIRDFIPKEYWNIGAIFKKDKKFAARLTEYKGKKLTVENKAQADQITADLKSGQFSVASIVKKERSRKPFAPFTTSSLQQDAVSKLGFTTKKSMMVAQQLYEGVEIKGHGTFGLVTYIR